MSPGTISIDARFRGPPQSSNGGYCAGRLAAWVGPSAEVTLHRPPPLEKALAVVENPEGGVALKDGDCLVATARSVDISPEAPPAPRFEDAVAASHRRFDPCLHKLPMCYVCGPDREPGDGMRLFSGPLDSADTEWSGPVATAWIPESYMADAAGTVLPEFVWAALDCPTAWAIGSPRGFPFVLLGRQAVRILRRPRVGEKCVVLARTNRREGRKYFSEGFLYGEAAETLAVCRATWIEVDPESHLGS